MRYATDPSTLPIVPYPRRFGDGIELIGYVAGGRAFDALAIVAPGQPSTHTWYTFPEMTPDEVVAFRTYDTELVRDGRTWFTPHSAFRDPDVELGRPARSSIELRVMCLYT